MQRPFLRDVYRRASSVGAERRIILLSALVGSNFVPSDILFLFQAKLSRVGNKKSFTKVKNRCSLSLSSRYVFSLFGVERGSFMTLTAACLQSHIKLSKR